MSVPNVNPASGSRLAAAGVSALSVYVPRLRVDLEAWCKWTDTPWDKVQSVVGRSFRVLGRHENVYTMAANAVLALIRQNDVDPRRVRWLGLGTESSTDNAVGAVIVRGMVDMALADLGLPRFPREMEVPEFKHACLGGMYALKSALRFVTSDGRGAQAIVVSSDVAEYERGSSGEQTQGAGAAAMLVEAEPALFSVDLGTTGSASAYRGPDFRKPSARHFAAGYAVRTRRPSDFPVFSGKYSTVAYLDETAFAVEAMVARRGVSAEQYYRDVKAWFFHRPYHLLPIQAMSFLWMRALVRSPEQREKVESLCRAAGVRLEEVTRETLGSPDLFAELANGASTSVAYETTSAVASVLRRDESFVELMRQTMGLGAESVKDVGNLYCAALPAWIAAGFEEALRRDLELRGAPLIAVGYGSGDAAEAWPLFAASRWREAAARIGFARALSGAIDLSRAQYEALHDRREALGIDYHPKNEFTIARVGERYDAGFQDLGVEYYEFMA